MLALTPRITPLVRQTADVDQPLPAVVDQLADVQTAIAVLENLEKNLKARLIESGLPEVCGTNVRARISHVAASVSIDYSAAAKKLLTADQCAGFLKSKDAYDKVQLYGFN